MNPSKDSHSNEDPTYLDTIITLTDRLDKAEARVARAELYIDELADEFGSRLQERLLFHKQRTVLEALLVEHYKLSCSEELYRVRRYPTASSINRVDANKIEADPSRVARIVLYYILWQHCAYASRQVLMRTYGWHTRNTQDIFARLECSSTLRKKREEVERQFLDGIGRTGEPITEWNFDALRKAWRLKGQCRSEGVIYQRSLDTPI